MGRDKSFLDIFSAHNQSLKYDLWIINEDTEIERWRNSQLWFQVRRGEGENRLKVKQNWVPIPLVLCVLLVLCEIMGKSPLCAFISLSKGRDKYTFFEGLMLK